MVDLDAPSEKHPAFAEWRFWLLINAKGADFDSSNKELVELSKYQSPLEEIEPDTGTHRIVLLVVRQLAGKLSLDQYDEYGTASQ